MIFFLFFSFLIFYINSQTIFTRGALSYTELLNANDPSSNSKMSGIDSSEHEENNILRMDLTINNNIKSQKSQKNKNNKKSQNEKIDKNEDVNNESNDDAIDDDSDYVKPTMVNRLSNHDDPKQLLQDAEIAETVLRRKEEQLAKQADQNKNPKINVNADKEKEVSIQAKERASRNGSTVVDISIPPPSFKRVPLYLSRSPLF